MLRQRTLHLLGLFYGIEEDFRWTSRNGASWHDVLHDEARGIGGGRQTINQLILSINTPTYA